MRLERRLWCTLPPFDWVRGPNLGRRFPVTKLNRNGLPHRGEAHSFARLALRPFIARSTQNDLNPKHNGRVEAMNRSLQEARARARGYRRVENFIAMAYLIAGKLTHLPASPFAPLLPVPHKTT